MKKFLLTLPLFLLFFLNNNVKAADITFTYSSTPQYMSAINGCDNIILDRGAYVIISGVTIKMNPNKSITINKGAVLKIENSGAVRSQITHTGSGTNYWSGIDIIGDRNYAQMPENIYTSNFFSSNNATNYQAMNQGLLWVENSDIMWANIAVNSSWGTGGGYFLINNARFDNNNYSIVLRGYSKFDQLSSVHGSLFNCSTYLPSTNYDFAHILIQDCSKINNTGFYIEGCLFNNSQLYSNLVGVSALNSFISIIKETKFYNLKIGVLSEKGTYVNSGGYLGSAIFEHCDRGAVVLGANSFIASYCFFGVDRKVIYGNFSKLVPTNVPVGLFISGAAYYRVDHCFFDKAAAQSIPPYTVSNYGIIVDNNASLGFNLIDNNTFIRECVGVQSQNEIKSTFLQCNDFGMGTVSLETINYDITVPKGTLRQHFGCGSSGAFYDRLPGNKFSTKVQFEHNIHIISPDHNLTNPLRYRWGSGARQQPQSASNLQKSNSGCSIPGCSQGEDDSIRANNFLRSFVSYYGSASILDSLTNANSNDTAEVEMAIYFKNHFLNELVSSISNAEQLDTALTVLRNDTSLTSAYQLVILQLNSGNYTDAQGTLDNISSTTQEALNFKGLYNILIPVYNSGTFESLDSVRNLIDSIASDSDFIAKQAKYLVNYIDETNSIIDSVEFTPVYLDSILPDEIIDTGAVEGNNYEIVVYPNPIQENLYADLTNNSGSVGNYTMKLFNSFGTYINENQTIINNTETQTLHIDTSGLGIGFYYLLFYDNDNAVIDNRIIIKTP